MLRITAIASLLFYLTVSIGVHVDVDTCCKSVAGLSLFSEAGDHTQALEDDCCAQSGPPSCHPMSQETPEGCPSDCVYIQVLLDTPPPAIAGCEVGPTSLDIDKVQFLTAFPQTAEVGESTTFFRPPPPLAIDEELYLIQGSFITYG